MAFVIPEGLHESLYPLAWIIGNWHGNGIGEFPNVPQFHFEHDVTFNHDGRDFLTYFSQSWITDAEHNRVQQAAAETGFWRVRPNNVIEAVICHSMGISEGWVGRFDANARIQLAFDQGYSSPSAKVVDGGQRLYGLVEGELFTSYDMAANGHDLQAHTWSSLARQPQ
jgi:hypothetical protein